MKNDTRFLYSFLRASMLMGMAGIVSVFGQDLSKPIVDKRARVGGGQGYQPERYNLLNINNLTTWHRSDGLSNHSPENDNGVYYPRGTMSAVYEDGLMWGARAYVDANKAVPAPYGQIIRVGGSTYGTNATAGPVIGFGADAVPAGDGHPQARIYRIRRDWKEMSDEELKRDAAESNEIDLSAVTQAQVDAIIADYRTSWVEWPVEIGAPFIDRNGNGIYDPPPPDASAQSLIDNQYDEPGIAGANPDTPADQVLWCAWNDLNREQAKSRFASEPVGLEIQMTLWGYERDGALGNMYFKKWKLINKGGVDVDNSGTKGSLYLDSMFVSQWVDPDLGTYSDDLTGCDIASNLGYVFNSTTVDLEYQKFNLPPPAIGYDLLQGPIVESADDVAIFDLQHRSGYKNLGMSAFAYFATGNAYSDPAGGYTTNAILWDKILRGFAPLAGPDQHYAYPPGIPEGAFPFSGDPVTQSGFLDGLGTSYSFPPGDRRFIVISGPFDLAPADTQEVVIALVAGLGADRLSSISVMKYNSEVAQSTFDGLFQIPDPPASPGVSIQEADQEIILDWGSFANVTETETKVSTPGEFRFEGYNVYQLPSATSRREDGKRIATFDLINEHTVILERYFDPVAGHIFERAAQFGTNGGIQRFFRFDHDFIKNVPALDNGTEYYLAVTAYSVAADNTYPLRSLESPLQILTVSPRDYTVAFGDTLPDVEHTFGSSDGAVYPIIIDEAALTGDTYRVTFTDTDSDGITEFNLENKTNNTMLITGETNQSGDLTYLTTEGFQARVVGASLDFKMFTAVANGAGPIVPPVGAAADFSGFPVPTRPGDSQQVGAGKWMVATGGQHAPYSQFSDRTTNAGTRWENIIPFDYEWRFTETGGYALIAYSTYKVIPVPFELWRIGSNTPDDPSDDVRMIPFVLDEDGNDQFNLQAIDHPLSGDLNDPYTDWVYWSMPLDDTPGETGYKSWESAVLALPDSIDSNRATSDLHTVENNMRRMVLVNWNGGDVTAVPPVFNQDMPETGTIFRIETSKPNTVEDVFEFVSNRVTVGIKDEGDAYTTGKIGVFPNPYDRGELNRPDPFVTFINLPRKATLRIFNLAGQLVRKLEKNDDSQFVRWDLRNFSRLSVASGVYVVHIELPDLDTLKTLKLTVIL